MGKVPNGGGSQRLEWFQVYQYSISASIEINNAYVQQDMPEIRVDDIEFDNFQVALDYLVYHSKI